MPTFGSWTMAQPALGVLWQLRAGDGIKLAVFVAILAIVGVLSQRGLLPRTKPIVAGELAVSD